MSFADKMKTLLSHRGVRWIAIPWINQFARAYGHGVREILFDRGVWIHETSRGYFAYHQPYLRLDMSRMDEVARENFFWGYKPRAGDVVMDVGAGVGEETLLFSRAVGERGKVISIEAHPRTFRCLEKLVQYNRLENVIAVHQAVTEPSCPVVTIGDSDAYLANRLNSEAGISVPARTIDAIHHELGLGRVNFLKMNIEGAERLAIRGMAATLEQTEVLCVSCHDFLADNARDDSLRTKSTVRQFLHESGFKVVERSEPDLPCYIRDQLWAYNEQLMRKAAS